MVGKLTSPVARFGIMNMSASFSRRGRRGKVEKKEFATREARKLKLYRLELTARIIFKEV